MTLTRSSNTITDLFEGYEVNLLNTTSSAAKLTSEVDVNEATVNLKSFVDSINTTRKILNEKTFRGLHLKKLENCPLIQLLNH